MSQKQKALLCLLAANVIFGFSFLFSKIAFSQTSPMIALSIRFLLAFALLNVLVLCKVVCLRIGRRDIRKLILVSLLEPTLYFICESYGIKWTSTSFSGAVIALIPVAAMALGAIFLKEKPTLLQTLSMLCSIAGVVLISVWGQKGGTVTLPGFLLLIGAVISSACYTLLTRKYSQDFTAFDRTYVTFAVSSCSFVLLAIVENRGELFHRTAQALSSLSFWGAILYLSVISSVVAFLMINYALTHISVTITASFSNLTTVVSVLAGVLLLHEPFSILQVIAVALILLGVYGVNKLGARPDAPQQEQMHSPSTLEQESDS